MDQNYLIEVVKRDCPFCNTVHEMEKRQRKSQVLIKGELVEYDEIYFRCPRRTDDEENEFVSAEMMDQNLQRARNAYRKKHGLLTSDEIAEIRSIYNISQSDLALMLGWGEITVTRYESKSIQDSTYDQILRLVKADPMFAMDQLEKHKDQFNSEKYGQIKSTILKRINDISVAQLYRKTIEAKYINYQEPCDFNGYQKLDLKKLATVMAIFASYIKNLFKVRLMKLLWYTDALSFKQCDKSITGLVYVHQYYGALPIASSEIIHLPTLSVEETEINENVGYHIRAKNGGSIEGLEPDEIDIIYQVTKKFKNMSTQQIVNYMHDEDAYKNTVMNQIIPFSLCKTLKNFQLKEAAAK